MKKQELRAHYKHLRLSLAPGELDERSNAVCLRLFTQFQLSEKTVSMFLPIERLKEINTYLILEKGISLDVRIALPKMNPDTNSLRHFLFENHSQLEINALGIPEPKRGKSVKIKDLDIILVPLLAFDKNGHRVGYGKGYYDKLLRKCSPTAIFIGLSLFDEAAEIDDINQHDIPLHYCITPNNLIRFNEG